MSYYGRLNTGFEVGQSISPVGETDTFRVAFIKGLTYTVSATGDTLADPTMSITTTGGTLLYANDDISGSNPDSRITFTAGATRDLYVNVAESGNNATGSYTLTVTPGYASNHADSVNGTKYGDAIAGMDGNDTLRGGGGADYLYGQAGTDYLYGEKGNDQLFGGGSGDYLAGGDGADRLTGGAGTDRLIGGRGADRFIFTEAGDSTVAANDVISSGNGAPAFEGIGASGGDVLDLSAIDANALVSGNQAFSWSASHAAGTAHLSNMNGNTVFYGYTDGDGLADIEIVIEDGAAWAAGDYATSDFIL